MPPSRPEQIAVHIEMIKEDEERTDHQQEENQPGTHRY